MSEGGGGGRLGGAVVVLVGLLISAAGLVFSAEQISGQTYQDCLNREQQGGVIADKWLDDYDSDKTQQAREGLTRYANALARLYKDPGSSEAMAFGQAGFARFIDKNDEVKRDFSAFDFGGKTPEKYFDELNQNRRKIKTLYTRMRLIVESNLVAQNGEAMLYRRVHREDEFIANKWLPIERAQNAARYFGRPTSNAASDKEAADLSDWFGKWAAKGEIAYKICKAPVSLWRRLIPAT
jgi:hypothetical protein